MTAVAPERVNRETGEVLDAIIAATPFSPKEYLSRIRGKDALETQQALGAAYDEACRALIGPNDVQVDKGRTFKKKSAWRKLARHFNISVEVVKVVHETTGADFLSVVTAKATAPWGQSYEDVGACCTDEAVGRRVITVADAIATASTRAGNRAISNLIAMGEVSAEEIGDRQADDRGATGQPDTSKGPVMPFGKSKGKLLSEHSEEELAVVKQWCEKKDAKKFATLIDQIDMELDSRRQPGQEG